MQSISYWYPDCVLKSLLSLIDGVTLPVKTNLRRLWLFSKVKLHGGELVIFSASQDLDHGECGVDCMVANSTRVHESGKLTTIPISGGTLDL